MNWDVAVLGEIAIDELRDAGEIRVGGASYAALAAAEVGAKVVLAGEFAEDIPAHEVRRLRRSGVSFDIAKGKSAPRWLMGRTGAASRRVTSRIPGTARPLIPSTEVPWFLVLSSEGLDLRSAVSAARAGRARIALDGHDDELLQPAAREVLADVDLLFLNWETGVDLTGARTVEEMVAALGRGGRATVIKHGRGGTTVVDGGRRRGIGAISARLTVKVGAGDTLAGTVVGLVAQGRDLIESVEMGVAAAGLFIERGAPAPLAELINLDRARYYVPPERLNAEVYVAAPFFTSSQLAVLRQVQEALEAAQIEYFSPLERVGLLTRDSSAEERRRTYEEDLAALDKAPAVVAVLDGDDPGTAWEVGYAIARDKPVVGLRTDVRIGPDNMIASSVSIASTLEALLDELFRRLAGA